MNYIEPYKVSISGGFREIGEKYYVEGPHFGASCCYDGWYLDPDSRWSTEKEAGNIARLMNMAYKMGRRSIKTEIKNLIGISNE